MLLAMAVFDTIENERTWMTKATIDSLFQTVDFDKHRLIISDNGSCDATLDLYDSYGQRRPFEVLFNGENLGTARAINRAWKFRRPGEHALKMDNDVHIHQPEWVDWMEDAFSRDYKLGILGLKRRDLAEHPWHPENHQFHSSIRMLPHEKGQRWIVIEEVNHCMGTCQAYSSLLLDKIGYLYQPGIYGFDDSLASLRAKLAGFIRAFLMGFEIDHLDPGGSPHGLWKIDQANTQWPAVQWIAHQYEMGIKDIYEDA